MNLLELSLKNIMGSSYRSLVVVFCVLLVAGLSLASTMVIRGSEDSLRLALQRLGADVVVVPEGLEGKVETALLMGKPVSAWMPAGHLEKVRGTPGVAVASPQLYLASLNNASCCAVSEMFMVAYEPSTDFAVQPWLDKTLGRTLGLGEAVGGTHVFVPAGEDYIRLYGYFLTLKGTLEPTGTGIDQTIFFTFDTAREMARISRSRAESPLDIPPDQISAVMVKVEPGAQPKEVVARIRQSVPGVSAMESPDLFRAFRRQMTGMRRSLVAALGIVWVLAIVVIGLLFTMAVNERRREMGVLRALGGTSGFVFRSLLLEAAILATLGAVLGLALGTAIMYLFRDAIVASLGMPFLLPPVTDLLVLAGAGLALALLSVGLAALVPAMRVSRMEPAVAMRV